LAIVQRPAKTQEEEKTMDAEAMTIRRARAEDAGECGRICYEAFRTINTQHNFPPDFPNADIAKRFLTMMFSHAGFFCVVAEQDGKIVGSNCLDERCGIAGVGPITVDPAVQNHGVGRALMQAVMDRAAEKRFAGVRLVQAAYHNRSLSLYAKLGFDAKEPLSVMQGAPIKLKIAGCSVRPAQPPDVEECGRICRRVHGHERSGELRDAIGHGAAVVVERGGRITGYSTGLAFFGYSVGEANLDLQALIASAEAFHGPGILVPTRNAALFRWCLENGLRVVQPMTLMTMGLYNEPAGAYLPSILF
jgi:predicted N-acetyltransferase YhbS